MEQETNTLKEEFLYQKKADDDFCIELYQYAVSAIQKTKVIPDIKSSIEQKFNKYFEESKKLFHRINQINLLANKKLDIGIISNLSNEDFFLINIPVNYCERKAQKLGELCQRIVFGTKLDQEQLDAFKFTLLVFFPQLILMLILKKKKAILVTILLL